MKKNSKGSGIEKEVKTKNLVMENWTEK